MSVLCCLKDALCFLAQKLRLLFSQVYSLTKNITHGIFPKGKKTYQLLLPIIFSQFFFFFSDSCKHKRLSDLNRIDCKRYLCKKYKNICKNIKISAKDIQGCFSCSWHSVNKPFFPLYGPLSIKK